ncbi:MAG TPA: hypothetical protein VGW38_06320, partial [Chloroflexota bacterium]|nr:hypothetical protein [Chloroflexota bacterium]
VGTGSSKADFGGLSTADAQTVLCSRCWRPVAVRELVVAGVVGRTDRAVDSQRLSSRFLGRGWRYAEYPEQ